jgi:starch-binding outer membrane protein, SusD/RagB family
MKHILKYSLITALLVGGSSCTNLDEEIQGDFTTKFKPANQGVGTKINVNKATPSDGLSGAFGKLFGGTANHGSYFSAQEISSDEAVITQKGGDWYDGGIWLIMHKHQFTPTVGGINGAWGDTYGGIFQCNDLLATTASAAGKAQLRTLRAYFYWRLLDMFGRVKIVTQTGVDAPQSARVDVYNFVVSELNAVLPDLPAGKQEYGRVSQGAANALLARLYLNAKVYKGIAAHDPLDLDKAIAAADAVINSGIYNLDANYAKVFAPDNVENSEHIFVAPFDEATGGGMNFAQMTLHYPSQFTYKLASQPWNGYSTLEEFYNSYDAADKRKAANFIVGPQKDTEGNPILDLAFDKGDEDGAEINYTPKINMLFPNGSRQAGARLGKFSFKIPQNNDMDNDYPLLRYGEVLLNKAEALYRKNSGDGTAKTLVDQIRTRAGLASIGTLTDGAFLAERGRELFQEALRRTDLIRFGAWGNAWWEKGTHPSDKFILFPIPAEQISSAKGTLTQNPDYQ